MARRRLPPRISRMFSQRLQYSRFKNTAKTTTERDDPTVMSTFEKLFVTPVKVNTSGFGRDVDENEIARKSAGLFPKGFTVKGKTFTEHLIDQIPKTIKNNGITLTTELMNTHTMIESSGVPVDSASKRGMLAWNDSDGTLAIYNNNNWLQLYGNLAPKPFSGTITWYGDRGIKAGGAGWAAAIDYWDITTTGNASDFGDLGTGREDAAGTSSTVRGLIMGGEYSTNLYLSSIEYITISITGQAYAFGDLAQGKVRYATATGNGVYGLCALAYVTDRHSSDAVESNTIEYVTIDTTGNATDFGDRTNSTRFATSVSNDTYSLFAGGFTNGSVYYNTIDYVTIDTPGNASDFGDLYLARRSIGACSDETRGLFAGGYYNTSPYSTNTIEYVTINTTGNAADFGDLTVMLYGPAGCSNGTYGNFFGGRDYTNGAWYNSIEAVTIQTTGNATYHGDLVASPYNEATGFSGSPS
jgi:hypothetical protein